MYCRAPLAFPLSANSSRRSTIRCPLRCTAITSPSRASSRRRNQCFLASDAVSLRANLDLNVLPRNTWNAEQLDRTFQEIRHIEAGGVTVICGHDEAQWHRLKKGGDAYD